MYNLRKGVLDMESFEKREVNVTLLMFRGNSRWTPEICHYNRSVAMKTLLMSSRGHEGQYNLIHPSAIFLLT
jgi:hypothetical protein